MEHAEGCELRKSLILEQDIVDFIELPNLFFVDYTIMVTHALANHSCPMHSGDLDAGLSRLEKCF